LAITRRELKKQGVNLILDFVPNHVAPDHPWVAEYPEHFIGSDTNDLRSDPSSFVEVCGTVYACGRDPYFPAWPDVLQLNAFDADLRQAVVQTVSSIAQQCDAIRCDMAMLKPESFFEASPELHGPPTYFTLGCHGRASRFNVLPISTHNS
jgi:glycosidase